MFQVKSLDRVKGVFKNRPKKKEKRDQEQQQPSEQQATTAAMAMDQDAQESKVHENKGNINHLVNIDDEECPPEPAIEKQEALGLSPVGQKVSSSDGAAPTTKAINKLLRSFRKKLKGRGSPKDFFCGSHAFAALSLGHRVSPSSLNAAGNLLLSSTSDLSTCETNALIEPVINSRLSPSDNEGVPGSSKDQTLGLSGTEELLVDTADAIDVPSSSTSHKSWQRTSNSLLKSEKEAKSVPKLPESTSNSTPNQSFCSSLTKELSKLASHGWYWGPISRGEAEDKLMGQKDGAFLVRDSSDDHYILSLSFRSFGRTLHTRIEYSNGLFSFYTQPEAEGNSSIISLIEESVKMSSGGIFCYSRGRSPSSQSFPVRLTTPLSRFTGQDLKPLLYLCRFVIRQHTRFDNIQKLPLPLRLKAYLEEGHY